MIAPKNSMTKQNIYTAHESKGQRKCKPEQSSQISLHLSCNRFKDEAERAGIDAMKRLSEKSRARNVKAGEKPQSWQKPAIGTPEYAEAMSSGWISWEEAQIDEQARSVKRDRAMTSTWQRKRTPRHERPQPTKNGQFSQKMTTEAARSQRITPNAKALLQIINAYCGKKGYWFVTKTFIANCMGVHPRTVQRYLADLTAEGFLTIDIDQSTYHGMVKGLVIRLAQKVFPRWLHKWWAENIGNLDRTKMSLNNPQKGISIIKYSREEWRFRCTNPVRFLT